MLSDEIQRFLIEINSENNKSDISFLLFSLFRNFEFLQFLRTIIVCGMFFLRFIALNANWPLFLAVGTQKFDLIAFHFLKDILPP